MQEIRRDPMRLVELYQKERGEQYQLILEHPKAMLKEVFESPEKIRGKAMCLMGNFAGFRTSGLVIRKFTYNFDTKKWTVWDVDLSDMFQELIIGDIGVRELEKVFWDDLSSEGFILSID